MFTFHELLCLSTQQRSKPIYLEPPFPPDVKWKLVHKFRRVWRIVSCYCIQHKMKRIWLQWISHFLISKSCMCLMKLGKSNFTGIACKRDTRLWWHAQAIGMLIAIYDILRLRFSADVNTIQSAESQKGVMAIQWCSLENQKGVIAVQSLYGVTALVVLSHTVLLVHVINILWVSTNYFRGPWTKWHEFWNTTWP